MENSPSYLLRFQIETRPWQEWRLALGEYIIGRAPDCFLNFCEGSLSLHHARLILSSDSIKIMDLGSANGTQIDGNPIPPRVLSLIRPGQLISLGLVSVIVTKPETADSSFPLNVAENILEERVLRTFPVNALPEGNFSDLPPPPIIREPPSAPTLVVRYRMGEEDWREKSFNQNKVVIGRGMWCDLQINHPKISRAHAMLEISEAKLWVTDLESTNGTILDSRRLTTGVKHPLGAGQVLAIGPYTLRVFLSAEQAAAEPIVVSAPGP